MERINPAFFYGLGASLAPITRMEPKAETRVAIWTASFNTDTTVRSLLDFYSALTVCRRTGEELINAIAEEKKWIQETPVKEWEKSDYSADSIFREVINKSKEFQTVLSEELQTLDAYHVTRKGIYDTTDLITHAENSLPPPVVNKISDVVKTEIQECGKCLAFDCATASGFHIMRAIEAVMYEYYIHVCKPKSKKSLGGWADYISALYNCSQDVKVKEDVREDVKKVIALLQQIKDQNRNLIMHPEMVLAPDDALTLFEIAKSAIIAMADRLPASKKE